MWERPEGPSTPVGRAGEWIAEAAALTPWRQQQLAVAFALSPTAAVLQLH